MKKKRICFPFEGNNLGGSHYSTLELIKNLYRKKFYILIVLQKKGYFYNFLKKKKIKFQYLPVKNFVGEKKGIILNLFRILSLINKFRNFIKKNNVDIIHGNDGRINLSWVIPTKISLINFIWHQRLKFATGWNLYEYLSYFSDKIICVSNNVEKCKPKFLKKKITKISNPISLGTAENNIKLQKKYFNKKNKKVLFLGNIIERKKIDIFIKSAQLIRLKLPNTKFYIVGLDKHNILKKLLNKNKIDNVVHVGFTDNPFLWLKKCDLLLSPAVDEALGRNIVEAMLSKIPVIAANSGGNREIIKNNINGWLYNKNDYVELSKKSIYVLNLHENELKILLNKAYSYAKKKYSINNHLKRMNEIYLEI